MVGLKCHAVGRLGMFQKHRRSIHWQNILWRCGNIISHRSEYSGPFRHIGGNRLGRKNAIIPPADHEHIHERLKCLILCIGGLAQSPCPGLLMGNGLRPGGRDCNTLNAITQVHGFDLGAHEFPKILGITIGLADHKIAGLIWRIEPCQFDAQPPHAAFLRFEPCAEFPKQLLDGQDDRFNLRGGSVKKPADGNGFGYAKRFNQFWEMAQRLIQAPKQHFPISR